jgi:FkbM family methyltransferase
MMYRARNYFRRRDFNRAIRSILDTPPIKLKDAPWRIVSMVTNDYIPMYLLALKSFYPKIGRGRVTTIINHDMPPALRETLARHVVGLDFVILEDIQTGACQRGGTWERLLYILDRSETEYTIQLDSDTLAVNDDLDEVVACIETNSPFTISDGFELMPLSEVAEEAEATPSDYVGIVAERAFNRYPGREDLRYVRGSSGFAGFSRGGFTRAAIAQFHREMEQLIGEERWREWGTEQCGSNFAIANSPGAVVLPRPEYASFTPRVPRREVKFFHFIGSFRYLDGYYVARGREVIAKLCSEDSSPSGSQESGTRDRDLPPAFVRTLSRGSALRYLAWQASGQRDGIWLRSQSGTEFQLRSRPNGDDDARFAGEIFVHRHLTPPVWIPPERVKLVVDLGTNGGLSCLYWLSLYRRAEIIAFEPHRENLAQCRANLARNKLEHRVTLFTLAAGVASSRGWIADEARSSPRSNRWSSGDDVDMFRLLAGRRIDILKIDVANIEDGLLEDPRLSSLEVRVLVLHCPKSDDRNGGYVWCNERLSGLGFRTFPVVKEKSSDMVWGYRISRATGRTDTVEFGAAGLTPGSGR